MQDAEVPNLIGMTKKEAKKALEDVGLLLETKESLKQNSQNEENEDKIEVQLPKAGIRIKQGSTVFIDK